jgi:hypothetical protein
MNTLDPNTLESIAEIICDSDGQHHRQYWELERFFANAGWTRNTYDESGWLRWTGATALRELRRNALVKHALSIGHIHSETGEA